MRQVLNSPELPFYTLKEYPLASDTLIHLIAQEYFCVRACHEVINSSPPDKSDVLSELLHGHIEAAARLEQLLLEVGFRWNVSPDDYEVERRIYDREPLNLGLLSQLEQNCIALYEAVLEEDLLAPELNFELNEGILREHQERLKALTEIVDPLEEANFE